MKSLRLFGILCLALSGCGYHAGVSGNLLPKDVHTIAVVPWTNATTQFKLPNYMAEAVSREILTRTRYQVVADSAQADATLYGGVVNMFSGTSVLDPSSNRGTAAQITLQLQVRLVAKDGKVLFNRLNIEFRDRYEISIDTKQYFDESEAALQRMSRQAARTVVSALLQNF